MNVGSTYLFDILHLKNVAVENCEHRENSVHRISENALALLGK
jgi:hypothetical protein